MTHTSDALTICQGCIHTDEEFEACHDCIAMALDTEHDQLKTVNGALRAVVQNILDLPLGGSCERSAAFHRLFTLARAAMKEPS